MSDFEEIDVAKEATAAFDKMAKELLKGMNDSLEKNSSIEALNAQFKGKNKLSANIAAMVKGSLNVSKDLILKDCDEFGKSVTKGINDSITKYGTSNSLVSKDVHENTQKQLDKLEVDATKAKKILSELDKVSAGYKQIEQLKTKATSINTAEGTNPDISAVEKKIKLLQRLENIYQEINTLMSHKDIQEFGDSNTATKSLVNSLSVAKSTISAIQAQIKEVEQDATKSTNIVSLSKYNIQKYDNKENSAISELKNQKKATEDVNTSTEVSIKQVDQLIKKYTGLTGQLEKQGQIAKDLSSTFAKISTDQASSAIGKAYANATTKGKSQIPFLGYYTALTGGDADESLKYYENQRTTAYQEAKASGTTTQHFGEFSAAYDSAHSVEKAMSDLYNRIINSSSTLKGMMTNIGVAKAEYAKESASVNTGTGNGNGTGYAGEEEIINKLQQIVSSLSTKIDGVNSKVTALTQQLATLKSTGVSTNSETTQSNSILKKDALAIVNNNDKEVAFKKLQDEVKLVKEEITENKKNSQEMQAQKQYLIDKLNLYEKIKAAEESENNKQRTITQDELAEKKQLILDAQEKAANQSTATVTTTATTTKEDVQEQVAAEKQVAEEERKAAQEAEAKKRYQAEQLELENKIKAATEAGNNTEETTSKEALDKKKQELELQQKIINAQIVASTKKNVLDKQTAIDSTKSDTEAANADYQQAQTEINAQIEAEKQRAIIEEQIQESLNAQVEAYAKENTIESSSRKIKGYKDTSYSDYQKAQQTVNEELIQGNINSQIEESAQSNVLEQQVGVHDRLITDEELERDLQKAQLNSLKDYNSSLTKTLELQLKQTEAQNKGMFASDFTKSNGFGKESTEAQLRSIMQSVAAENGTLVEGSDNLSFKTLNNQSDAIMKLSFQVKTGEKDFKQYALQVKSTDQIIKQDVSSVNYATTAEAKNAQATKDAATATKNANDKRQAAIQSYKALGKEVIEVAENENIYEKMMKTAKELGATDIKISSTSLSGKINETAKGYQMLDIKADKTNQLLAVQTGEIRQNSTTWDALAQSVKGHMGSLIGYLATFASFYQIVDVVKQAVSAVTELNSAMTTISLTMPTTKKMLDDLTQSTIDMAKETGTSVSQVSEAAKIYANMNSSASEIMQSSKPTVELASASGMDTASAADAIQAVMNEFNLSADQAMHISDVYETVSANMKQDFGKGIEAITEGVQTAGALANDAGMSFEKFAAIIGKTSEISRQSGSTIGNAWKSIISRISKSGSMEEDVDPDTLSKAAQALHAVGIEVYDQKGNFNNLDDILTKLSSTWNTLTDSQKADISYQVAGIRNANQFAIAMRAYAESTGLAEKAVAAKNVTDNNAAKYAESIQGKWNTLKDTYVGISTNLLDSKDLTTVETGLQGISNVLSIITKKLGLLGTTGITGGIIGTIISNKNISKNGTGVLGGLANNIMNQYSAKNTFDTMFSSEAQTQIKEALNTYKQGNNTITEIMQKTTALSAEQQNTLSAYLSNTKTSEINIDRYSQSLDHAANASSGLNAATIALNTAFSVGLVAAVSAAIYVIGKFATANAEAKAKADEAAKSYNSEHSSISDYANQISELNKKLSSNKLSYDETKDAKTQLLTIQKSLISSYGDEVKGIDLVNGSLKDQLSLLNKIDITKYNQYIDTLKQPNAWQQAGNALFNISSNFNGKDQPQMFPSTYDAMIKAMEGDQTGAINTTKISQKSFALQQLIDQLSALNGVSVSNNRINVTGHGAQDSYNNIKQIQDLVQSVGQMHPNDVGLQKYVQEVQKQAQSLASIYDGQIQKYQSDYQTYIDGKIITDKKYSTTFEKISSDQQAYQDALTEKDTQKQQKTKDALIKDISSAYKSALASKDTGIIDYIKQNYTDVWNDVMLSSFNDAYSKNVDNIKNKVDDIVAKSSGKSSKYALLNNQGLTDQDFNNYDPNNISTSGSKYSLDQLSSMQALYDLAQKYGITVANITDEFVKQGKIQSQDAVEFQKQLDAINEASSKKFTDANEKDLSTFTKEAGIDTSEELELWKKVTKEVSNASDAEKKYFELRRNVTQVKFDDQASQMQNIGTGLAQLQKIYDDVKDKGNFDYSSIVGSGDKNTFNDTFGNLSSVESFKKQIESMPTDIKSCQSSFDELATEYIYMNSGLKDVTDSTAAMTEKQLEQNGVVNAAAIVEKQLAVNKEVNAKANEAEMAATSGSVDAIVNQCTALATQGEMSAYAKAQLFELIAEEDILQNKSLSFDEQIAAIEKLAGAFLGASAAASLVAGIGSKGKVYTIGSKGKVYGEKNGTGILGEGGGADDVYALIESVVSKYQSELAGTELPKVKLTGAPKSSSGSAGKSEADAYVEGFKKELENLKSLKDDGLISEAEYLDRYRALYEKYFKDKSKYAKEYYDNQRQYLEEMKSLYDSAISGAINILSKKITKVKDEEKKATDELTAQKKAAHDSYESQIKDIEKQEKALNKQKEALQKQIDAYQSQIDAINKANEAREHEITLEKAKYDLDQALSQKTKLVYHSDKGFTYDADTSNVRDKQDSVKNAQDQLNIDAIQKQIDALKKSQDAIDNQVTALNERKEAIQEMMDASDSYFEKEIDNTKAYFDSILDGLDKQKERWEDLKDIEEKAKTEANLQSLGFSQNQILDMGSDAFGKFKTQYMQIMKDLYSGNDKMKEQLSQLSGVDLSSISGYIDSTADSVGKLSTNSKSISNITGEMNKATQAAHNLAYAIGGSGSSGKKSSKSKSSSKSKTKVTYSDDVDLGGDSSAASGGQSIAGAISAVDDGDFNSSLNNLNKDMDTFIKAWTQKWEEVQNVVSMAMTGTASASGSGNKKNSKEGKSSSGEKGKTKAGGGVVGTLTDAQSQIQDILVGGGKGKGKDSSSFIGSMNLLLTGKPNIQSIWTKIESTIKEYCDKIVDDIKLVITAMDAFTAKQKTLGGIGGTDKNKISSYASGTSRAKRGLSFIGEQSPEILVDNNGNASYIDKPSLMNLEGGETIYNGESTKKLVSNGISALSVGFLNSSAFSNLAKNLTTSSMVAQVGSIMRSPIGNSNKTNNETVANVNIASGAIVVQDCGSPDATAQAIMSLLPNAVTQAIHRQQ